VTAWMTRVGLLLGGIAALDIAVFLGFCVWAAWYTFTRRPAGAPWPLWRRLATSWYLAHHPRRDTSFADYIRHGRYPDRRDVGR
jgi:hypothetical protein